MPNDKKLCEILSFTNTEPGKDIGIEIEMEGNKPFPQDGLGKWFTTEDGSLRGFSMEYVTNGPISYEEVGSYIDHLKNILAESGVKIEQSFRAGVHVHINCLNLTVPQITTFATVYYCMETALTRFCGERREGNFFCLRLQDAEYSLAVLCKTLKSKDLTWLNTDDLRYAALNLRSLWRHGTLEFRAMETTPDLEKIQVWAEMLYRLREYSLTVTDRKLIAYDISYYGPKTWVEKVLGPETLELLDYQDLERDVVKDMRMVQELINLKDK